MSFLTPQPDRHVHDLEMKLAEALDRIAELEASVDDWRGRYELFSAIVSESRWSYVPIVGDTVD